MPTVRKSVIVAHPAERMFALVDDVERYPEFLPWCSAAQVLERTKDVTRARIEIDYHGLKSAFATSNRKQEPLRMDLELEDGPFERLEGRWTFTPLGDEGCRVELALDYSFANAAMETLLGPVFGHIMGTLVEGFVERAEATA